MENKKLAIVIISYVLQVLNLLTIALAVLGTMLKLMEFINVSWKFIFLPFIILNGIGLFLYIALGLHKKKYPL